MLRGDESLAEETISAKLSLITNILLLKAFSTVRFNNSASDDACEGEDESDDRVCASDDDVTLDKVELNFQSGSLVA